ncbi:MAG: DUF1565 domain-containing protein [Bacteroidales bacterium]|nr:DUF1565 domain-containing protein [Bacteroidales bacterium]
MKRLLPIFLLIIGLSTTLNAQWVSPGDGITYTLPDLVAATEGVVTNEGTVFTIHQDLTISYSDVLLIDNQVTRIDAPGVLITINGSFTCSHTGDRVKIYGTETQQFSMRFDNASECYLHKLYLSDGAGIKVVESDITFDDVKFVYFNTDYCHAVIDIFNCDPVINNCYFMLNEGSAISSPANGQSSPQITGCELDANVDGLNVPQINLGPGGDDTIRIVGNNIHGTWATFHTGGISVADLMGIGDTKVLLKDNTIKDGRYGYNQQGQTISSIIEDNRFINNNHEDNPMNGGSGISIYGTSTNNKAILRNNVITGNLWGITAIYLHDIDLGTEDDWGYNEIYNNGNGGVTYDLYNNASCDIMAVGNDWRVTDEALIEDHIFHQVDDPSLGLVTFIPFVGYDGMEEITLEETDIDLSKATLYTIAGQRVRYTESLKPGIYVVVTEKTTKKLIIK